MNQDSGTPPPVDTYCQNRGTICVVDDDREMLSLLKDFLSEQGFAVLIFEDAESALICLRTRSVDLVVSDVKMPRMDGLDFLRQIKLHDESLPVVLVTAFGSVESAIDAVKRGAYDYIVKPFKLAETLLVIERAVEFRRLRAENAILRSEMKREWSLAQIVGKSPQIKMVFDLAKRVSDATANVLITGESGTGKELIAKAVHHLGRRRDHPFVAINCAAIPEDLLESELFGHARGAFTGAIQRKKGLFEEANGGTLFLDEIGDMSISLQAKLLRVLQDRTIRAVGDTESRPIDVRIIAATHRDLKERAKNHTFREDLYYRLSVIPISVPALRDRTEDIPLLAEHFLRKYAAANGRTLSGFTREAMEKLISSRWDGNVRELENVIERAVVLCMGSRIDLRDLPTEEMPDVEQVLGTLTTDFPTVETLERRYIEMVLQKTEGRKDKAASILGINRRTLYRKEREFGLCAESDAEPLEDLNAH
jgi:DNA-binding NtrC family response regulator